MNHHAGGRRLIKATELRARLGGISAMTEWRWVRTGVLPNPTKICGRNYYDESVADAIGARTESRPE